MSFLSHLIYHRIYWLKGFECRPWWANNADLPSGSGQTLVWSGTSSPTCRFGQLTDIVCVGVKWYSGANNIFPAAQKTVSTFDALDQILQHYANLAIYPNMKQIVRIFSVPFVHATHVRSRSSLVILAVHKWQIDTPPLANLSVFQVKL